MGEGGGGPWCIILAIPIELAHLALPFSNARQILIPVNFPSPFTPPSSLDIPVVHSVPNRAHETLPAAGDLHSRLVESHILTLSTSSTEVHQPQEHQKPEDRSPYSESYARANETSADSRDFVDRRRRCCAVGRDGGLE